MKTLEQYLRENYEKGVIDHVIRVTSVGDGGAAIYIHPQDADGDTLDFAVLDNELLPLQIENGDGTYEIMSILEGGAANDL
jgi:hypothetical protein